MTDIDDARKRREERIMNTKLIQKILKDTDYIRVGGTAEELKAAEYLRDLCIELGAEAHLESFPVQMAEMHEAHLYADGVEIPCKGYLNCGSGEIEAPFIYLPNTDPTSLSLVKGKIVLLDTGVGYFGYHDLIDNGAVGFITYDGHVLYRDHDIDQRELRSYVHTGTKILGVNLNARDALKLVRKNTKTVRIVVDEKEYDGESRNVVAELPGKTDEWITLSAHYDSTSLSHGAYDNMTGCIGLIGVLEEMKKTAPNRYGLRFVFCGSEERGLLGSKAYTAAHEEELKKIALNINIDMIGTYMGRFIACCSTETKLVDYITYFCAEKGWGMNARQGVYSSDSTPFADKGVPALSFARLAPGNIAPIHNRYDTMEVLSAEQIRKDVAFIADFTAHMANAVKCPVDREIPENVKNQLEEYLARKRKK